MARARRKKASRSTDALKRRGAAEVAEIIKPALEARANHRGITLTAALDPMTGSEFGVLRVSEKITRQQYDAGIQWANLDRRYKILSGAKQLAAKSGLDFDRYGSTTDPDDPDQIDLFLRVKARHEAAYRALSQSCPMGRWAIEKVIDDDRAPGKLIEPLKTALNALMHNFGVRSVDKC